MKSSPNLFRRPGILPCLAAVTLIPSFSLAGNHTWDGGGVDGSWLTGANWDDDPAGTPVFGVDSVQTFNSTGAGNLATLVATSPNVGTLAFNANADNDISIQLSNLISGGAARSLVFTVNSGNAAINVDPDAQGDFMIGVSDGTVNLSDSLVIDHQGSGNLTINRVIQNTTAITGVGVTKTGGGTLTLAVANTFDGGLTLSGGTLNINNAGAIGKDGGTFAIQGGTIDNTSAAGITVTKIHPITIDGDFAFTGTKALALGTGAVSLGTAPGTSRTITVNAGTLTLGGVIANGTTANSLIKAGGGILTLNGANSFTGPIIVNSGSFSTGASATFTSSGLTIGGAAASGSPALVGSGSLNIPTTIAAASGGVAGTQQPGGTTAGGTHTFTNTLNYESGAVLAWQVNTLAATDPGANTDNHGNYDKVVANGAAGSVTGGAAVFRIAIANSVFSDPYWDTNKSWSNIYSGTGAPTSLAAVFSSFAGVGVDANGIVTGQGQFTFVGSTLQWTAGGAPTNLYDIWSAGLANPAFDFDSDNDGIENGLEWILGGSANQNDTPSVLPAVTGNAVTGLTLSFTREEDAIAETTLTVEYASDLSGPWTSAIIDQDGGSFPNGVGITIDEVPSPDDVTVVIPATNAAGGKLFARVKGVRN